MEGRLDPESMGVGRGGGIDTAVRGRADELDDFDEPDLPRRAGAVVALAGAGGAVARFSPLLSRAFNDAAPVRAFAGVFSLLLPLAALLVSCRSGACHLHVIVRWTRSHLAKLWPR